MSSHPPELEGHGFQYHVLPIDDVHSHTAQRICWCHPIQINGVWVHNAKDCREVVERTHGRGVKPWIRIAEYIPLRLCMNG